MPIVLGVPPDNPRGPQYAEQVLAALHQANPARLPCTLSFTMHDGRVSLACACPPSLAGTLHTQLAAQYPDCTLVHLSGQALDPPPGTYTHTASIHLSPDIFPIRRYPQFDDAANRNLADPLAGILAALAADRHGRFHSRVALVVRPASPARIRLAQRVLFTLGKPLFRSHPRLARAYAVSATSDSLLRRAAARLVGSLASLRNGPSATSPLTLSASRTHDREHHLAAADDKLRRHLFEVRLSLSVSVPREHSSGAVQRIRQLAAAFGQFTDPGLAAFRSSPVARSPATPPRRRGFLLSCEELATLWHPATATVRAPAMRVTESRECEPPVELPDPQSPEITLLGRAKFRSRRDAVGLKLDDRRRHMAIVGKTGMGKTTLLHRLLASDIRSGRGTGLIDPHGDLCEALLQCIPTGRTNDLVLFDAADRSHPPAFNPLDCPRPADRPLVASGIVASFKKLYGDSWGPRLEHLLRNAVLALLEVPGTSLLSLQRMLADAAFRRAILPRVEDPIVRAFWQTEFASWKPQYQAEAVAPVLNKVGQFLSQPILRAIVGQHRTRLDLRRVLDEGQILLVNLSKGRIGEDACTLLGSLLVSQFQLAAMRRADTPEAQRHDFFLAVDEFQNFATDSFATILSEARKYRLSLTLANQYLAQIPEETLAAVFGNVGSLLVFQVGACDAETLAQQLAGDLTPRDLMNLPRYTAYARLLIDGMPSRPFSMTTVPVAPIQRGTQRPEVLRRTSRHRYARPAQDVASEIAAALAPA